MRMPTMSSDSSRPVSMSSKLLTVSRPCTTFLTNDGFALRRDAVDLYESRPAAYRFWNMRG